ncbi:MAG TPA: plastocyanin/azurin family copper-binding protein [Ktedonobacterales bacterium]|jgi:plastocyanin
MKGLTPVVLVVILSILLTGCVVQSQPKKSSGTTIRMGPNNFEQSSITIKKGATITFVDDPSTGSLHILVIGTQGSSQPEEGAPDFKGSTGITFQPGQSWTSPPWQTPGTYHVTCTVHPTTMNLIVMVTSS